MVIENSVYVAQVTLMSWCHNVVTPCKDISLYEPVYDKRGGGLWHDIILVRKEYYDVIAVCFSIFIPSLGHVNNKK